MAGTEESRGRERDLERFLTFVDAVVAIALTLLVLPLVDVAGELRVGESVLRLLGDHATELFAFALSFVVIGRLWFVQHGVMRNVVAQEPTAMRFTMLWLFLIVLLPFPTALVAEAGEQPTTKVFYVATIALSTLALGGMSRAVARHPEVRDSERAPEAVRSVTTALALLVALALMLAVPFLQYWPMLLLLVDQWLLQVWQRVVRR